MKKPRFNDNYYCRTVQDWEEEVIPNLLWLKRFEWALAVCGPLVIIGLAFARTDWLRWLGVVAVGWLLITVFTFFEELNENLRFVRHQLREFHDAVNETARQYERYDNPEKNVTPFDIVSDISRNLR